MGIGKVTKISEVFSWGDSLGVCIPQESADTLKLKEGDFVSIDIEGDTITIRRAKGRKKWSEKELLQGVTPEMCGPELIPGRAGRELI